MMSCYEEGFRLADALSECSMRSKARIDSLFEDTRSICSSTLGGWYASVSNVQSLNPGEIGAEEQTRANGAVQARIEAMFASVEAETGTPGESAAAVLPVKYMGAAPVGGRVASVRGLQEPLRHLLEHMDHSVNAELEISRRGLTFRTADLSEKTNPFRRIAVWSALRLHCKTTPSGQTSHAFLPLVGDDKAPSGSDEKHAELYRYMRGVDNTVNNYPPIFAVVMRRPGAARLLECHAFACRVEEDAIAAAATLYRALLADLDANRRRPRQTNGLGCVSLASVASSIVEHSNFGAKSTIFENSRTAGNSNRSEAPSGLDLNSGHPVRPPRVKKNSTSNSQTSRNSLRLNNLDKAPRRKKISEIKAEDILEARSRKITSNNSRIAAISGKESNCGTNNSNKSRISRTRNEERNNLRNKTIYNDNKESMTKNNEKNDENCVNSSRRIYNNYEKLPKISKSFDYCNNPEIRYSFVDRNGSSEINEDFYEVNQNSYEINKIDEYSNHYNRYSDKKEDKNSISRSSEIFEKVATINSSNNRENLNDKNKGKRKTRDKIYEDHFRDADKIYSLGEEDVTIFDKRGHFESTEMRKTVEDNFSFGKIAFDRFDSMNDGINDNYNKFGDRENNSKTERQSRINTMDKPTRNMARNVFSAGNRFEFENSTKVRKRSRAGSEPPFSRTEEIIENVDNTKLKRSQSDLDIDKGDPMTRVELPRRGSFLKPGSARIPNNVKGGTPLGFTELFDEFRNQEGLTSIDDILDAIIDPEGMSFNDLKPLYKEFLLKLAATLTQDELYQRSASIMRRRRRPQRRRSTRKPCLLGRAIKRSVSRLKGGPTEFTSVIFPARKLNDSFDSSSSCDARINRTRVLASRLSRKRSSWRNVKSSAVGQTTSEDSDTCRRLARNAGAGANRSSSGYVSCSECSYDSESCTCVSADKCYCSLSRKVGGEEEAAEAAEAAAAAAAASTGGKSNGNAVICACDTDSCSDSNKCYCARRTNQPTILEQLRQRGIVPSESTLSRAGSPDRVKTSRATRNHASSRSLESLQVRPSPGRSSSDNLALDYDLFSPGKKNGQHSSTGSEKVLVVSARDPQGRLVYVGGGGNERDKNSYHSGTNKSRREAHHEALSIKKSAEIAAIFAPDSVRSCRRTSSVTSVKSSISLEAGLGYLP